MTLKLTEDLGLLRVCCAVVPLKVGDVDYNVNIMVNAAKKAAAQGVQVLSFPEMAITGYTIADLMQQTILLAKVREGLNRLVSETAGLGMVIIAGLPVRVEQKIFNCAAVINSGQVLGIVPKTYLPSYKEYYEERWFASANKAMSDNFDFFGTRVNFGTDLLFRINGMESAVLGVEICEDMWVPLAPHEYQALAGATVLVNISASNELLAKPAYRKSMVASESGRCLAAYCYVSSGIDESSNDVVFSGHAIIAESGIVHKESERLETGEQLIIADVDLERLVYDRTLQTSFHDISRQWQNFRIIEAAVNDSPAKSLYYRFSPHPFVPADPNFRAERCRDIFSMQVAGLHKKLTGAKKENLVIGISGGLDSTLAFLVAVKTMDFMNLPRSNIKAFTLPGFGTSNRTLKNAQRLCEALHVPLETVDIQPAAGQHLKDIKHSFDHEDVVFENVQARYRTELLFNIANHLDAIVLGTADLTEIALGWSTFAGDHMSHYHVNASVPKTLVRYLVRWVAEEELAGETDAPKVLIDIIDTPISPELKRPVKGRHIQKSEDVIGPVELADYFLYPFIRFGMRPGKILFLANEVRKLGLFTGKYSLEELYKWEKSFINRFFHNQFKRTCLPEGPKVGSVSLSPRGDWRMPSDAEPALWLEDLDKMYKKLKRTD